MASAKPPKLWYFTDPMCSWCWGFTPTIEELQKKYGDQLETEMMLGGLHPDETTPLTEMERHDLYHDWRQVNERSGQPFNFDHAMPVGFICNSEPPSRAVLAAASLDPDLMFPMMKAAQSAFYAEGRDITKTEILAELAVELGLDHDAFLEAFESDAMREKCHEHFVKTRQMGVRGLPALMLQQNEKLHQICNTWQSAARIRAKLDDMLDE